MLSASVQTASLKPDPLQSSGFDILWRAIGRFIRRVVHCGARRAPALPEELHGDVGFGESLPFDREAAFWEARRRSGARDLPL